MDLNNISHNQKKSGSYNIIARTGSVRPSGFEPETYGLENRCSIQLSYGRILRQKYKNIAKTQTKQHFLSILLNNLSLITRICLYHSTASHANDAQVFHINYYF